MELVESLEKLEVVQDLERSSCPFCSRKFVKSALDRHEKVCQKLAAKKALKKPAPHRAAKPLRAAPRAANERLAAAKPTEPQLPGIKGAKTLARDIYECSGCERTFNESAAEKHVPFCVDSKRKLPNKVLLEKNRDKLKLLHKRTSYRPPKEVFDLKKTTTK